MIKVVGHRILVKPFAVEELDESYKAAKAAGIYIPDLDEKRREQNAVDKGVVISVGATAFKDFGGDPWCKEGDVIAYAKYAGKWIEDKDKTRYIVLNDEDCICVLGEDNE